MCKHEVNGVPYPCDKCAFHMETDGTCMCYPWKKWFKAYWKELRKRYNNVKK